MVRALASGERPCLATTVATGTLQFRSHHRMAACTHQVIYDRILSALQNGLLWDRLMYA